MSVYRKFDKGDVLQSVVYTKPRTLVASGTTGWKGNQGVSGSVSLYGGVRSKQTAGITVTPLDPSDTHSVDRVIFISGSYPATGTVSFAKVHDSVSPGFGQSNSENWYEEHFHPILNLFEYYGRFNSNYFTGSYDYYSLFLNQVVSHQAPHVVYSGATLPEITNALTCEARIKPTIITGSHDFTIQSQQARWKLFITGSTGQLAFSDYGTTVTSSIPVSLGRWQHVSCIVGAGSASLLVNGSMVGSVPYTGTFAAATASSPLFVGAENIANVPDNGFSGYVRESRVWKVQRTWADVSGSSDSVLFGSGSSNLVHYARFNDGPVGKAHGFSVGSGSFDYSIGKNHGQFVNVDIALPRCPQWQPCDDQNFVTPKTQIDTGTKMFRVLHIPSMYYGRQIASGSVQLLCEAYNGKGIVRVLQDDGRGGLYVSGSMTRNLSGEDSGGVLWNKIGNVFYTEGLVVITDPSLFDFGAANRDWNGTGDLLSARFDGDNRVPTKVFLCRLGHAEANASSNPTFSEENESGQLVIRGDRTTWITAVGLYNEDRKLVAVAKLASPIRKREKDNLTIRLKFDL